MRLSIVFAAICAAGSCFAIVSPASSADVGRITRIGGGGPSSLSPSSFSHTPRTFSRDPGIFYVTVWQARERSRVVVRAAV